MPRIRTILLGAMLLSLVGPTATADTTGQSSRAGLAQAGLMSIAVLSDEAGNDNSVLMLAATSGPRVEDGLAKVDPSALFLICRDECVPYRPAVFTLATDANGGRLTGLDSYLGAIDISWTNNGELLFSPAAGIGIAQCSSDASRAYEASMTWRAMGGVNDAVNGARQTAVSGHVGPFTITDLFEIGSLSLRTMYGQADITWTNGACNDGS